MSADFTLYPAIDLLDGKCVRLYQGDYDQETIYSDSPVDQAKAFADAGARWIHVVDLDAAKTGEPTNREVVGAIAAGVDIPVQTGGGIRSVDAARPLFDLGITRVVIGTAALENPELVSELASAGHRLAVGLDVKGTEVAVRGWLEGSGRNLNDVVADFADAGADTVICTQIAVDGTLEGPDTAGLSALLAATEIPVVASGGVGTAGHIAELAAVEVDGRTLEGVIVGRALYEGKFDLPEALAACRRPDTGGDTAQGANR